MEDIIGSFSSVELISHQNLPDMNPKGWQIGGQAFPRMQDIICPVPRRAFRAPVLKDGVSRFSCNPRRLPIDLRNNGFEMLDVILNKDDLEDDHDNTGGAGYFCGSPPVRANNPIVNDVQFTRPTCLRASPLRTPVVGKPSNRVENTSSCRVSPKVRIEGFASGNSDNRCVLPAFA
ncbi:hypothetical protein QJS04_geneDACA021513 [Acorus gramineus]|uniref:Uncharacterized protein n=1 Tax=Acorus gramineus TaxID=55184 RepID=A0AAV9A707_ACOGR|nr:hypothetical protein QJS04_geneDACA021513 [Acorus gramineus]